MPLNRRWLLALAGLSLCAASTAAAQQAPAAEWSAPPRRYVIFAPATAFPDPVGISMALDVRRGLSAEAGVTALAPGAFVRLGVYTPISSSAGHGTDLMAYGGYRALTLPLIETLHGPTVGIGVRRWPRGGGWGWQVNTGLWITDEEGACGDCSGRVTIPIVLPEVRLALMRAR